MLPSLLHGDGSGVRLYDSPDLKLLIANIFISVGWGRSFLSVAWPTGVQLVFFFCSGFSKLFGAQASPSSGSLLNLLSSLKSVFNPTLYLETQFIVSTIKFRKGFSKFMIAIALLEKFCR